MDNKPQTTAKDFFLYFAITIALYVSVVSFLTLNFAIIDKILPLIGGSDGSFATTIRMSVAALIIFFPTFFYLTWLIYKSLKANPETRSIWVRKWMIYLDLFVAGLTMAIDLVVLIYRLLGAEDLTLRFFLKVFFVFGTTIIIFVFYLYNLKRKTFEYKKSMNIFLALISALVLTSIVAGIMLIGSPALERAKSFDAQRINDLISIQNQIVYTEWENTGDIPTSTSVLNDPISNYVVPTDPETKAPYKYTKLSKNSFELCAVLETTNRTSAIGTTTSYDSEPTTLTENWQHDAGKFCFSRTIDPTMYKVVPVPTGK
jgi:hypothetical protein